MEFLPVFYILYLCDAYNTNDVFLLRRELEREGINVVDVPAPNSSTGLLDVKVEFSTIPQGKEVLRDFLKKTNSMQGSCMGFSKVRQP